MARSIHEVSMSSCRAVKALYIDWDAMLMKSNALNASQPHPIYIVSFCQFERVKAGGTRIRDET